MLQGESGAAAEGREGGFGDTHERGGGEGGRRDWQEVKVMERTGRRRMGAT